MGEAASTPRPLRFTVKSSSPETDAPTVDDLLGQLRDMVDLLREIDRAVAPDGKDAIEWRVVDAHRNSPLSFVVAPFSKHHGMNIIHRDRIVRETASAGLMALRVGGDRPAYFSDRALRKAESLFQRVTNGLSDTVVEFDETLPSFQFDAASARSAKETIARIQTPEDRPYREVGSIEGFFQAAERDGLGRALIQIKVRLTGEVVKCFVRGAAEMKVEARRIGDLWKRNTRIIVIGEIAYRGLGRIAQVDASDIKFMPDDSELPTVQDIIDLDFTGGLTSEQFLEERRNGFHS
jgi:hypothetical protein